MGKNSNLKQLARFVALAVTHKIGQLINKDAIYAEKYSKEFENFIAQARIIKLRENWNNYDKEAIKKEAKIEAVKELTKKEFIGREKIYIF